MKTKRLRRIAIWFVLVLAVLGGVGYGILRYHDLQQAKQIISSSILTEVAFPIYYPSGDKANSTSWQLQKLKTSFDTSSGVLSMTAEQLSSGRNIILTEQATPGVFADVPTQYSKLLTTLNEYNELQLDFGTVALTHPKELNGGQTAVINKGSTLLFARPSTNLSDSDWQNFFQSLQILR